MADNSSCPLIDLFPTASSQLLQKWLRPGCPVETDRTLYRRVPWIPQSHKVCYHVFPDSFTSSNFCRLWFREAPTWWALWWAENLIHTLSGVLLQPLDRSLTDLSAFSGDAGYSLSSISIQPSELLTSFLFRLPPPSLKWARSPDRHLAQPHIYILTSICGHLILQR